MIKKVSIIGGDLRIVKLVEMLLEDGFEVATYGLENAEYINKRENVKECFSIDEVINESKIIIGPIPLSSNGEQINTPFSNKIILLQELGAKLQDKLFIAGSIKSSFYDHVNKDTNTIIDLLDREELAVLNTISTAEGAIQIAMEETPTTIHGSNVLIMGFGRIGKILAKMLQGIGANVYCEARKNEDMAWIKAYGYNEVALSELNEQLNKFNVIINTIPHIIIDESNANRIKKDCLLIDLASNPGGIDKEAVKKEGLKLIWALSLPGKVAPITSAEFIKNTIYNILKEIA